MNASNSPCSPAIIGGVSEVGVSEAGVSEVSVYASIKKFGLKR